MNDDRIAQLLSDIRDGQKLQLARQEEALALQREQFAMVQKQVARTEQLQDRAERIQDRSAQLVGMARKSMIVVLPIIAALIAYLSWLLFR
jgi:uncharacterized membrane protein (DUF106 family)